MSDEPKYKDKTDFSAMMPIFGLDLGRELGSIDARLAQHEKEFVKIEARFDRVETKVDKMAAALHRLDERTRSTNLMVGGIMIAVLAGIALQILFR